jgi:hypothetical protein
MSPTEIYHEGSIWIAKFGTSLTISATTYTKLLEKLAEVPSKYEERTNLMSGFPIVVAKGTPLCCDPSSETYWSM